MSENDDDTYDVNDDEDDDDDEDEDEDDDDDDDDDEYMHDANYEDVDDDDDDDDNSDDDDSSDDDDNCNIQRAIRQNKSNSTILKLIKFFPMEIKHKNRKGYYPLHTACEYHQHDGRNDIAIKLIELCPEIAQYPDSNGRYPLHLAVERYSSDDETVMKLIEIFPMAVSKSTIRFGTALHLACTRNQSQRVITKIIELNPQAIQVKYNGFYPIHRAIDRGLPIEVIKRLVDGDPLGMHRRTEQSILDDHLTSFHLACQTDRSDLVQYFMQRSDLQINVRGSYGTTPLSFACLRHRHEIVDLLLHHPDIDVNVRDRFKDTPLHTVFGHYSPREDPEILVSIVQKLLDHSSILINENNHNNKTPLDLIKTRLHQLEEQNDNTIINRFPVFVFDNTIIMKRKIQCSKEIITLLEEFPVEQKWKSYCYHLNNIMDL